jgi:hypothetical protein
MISASAIGTVAGRSTPRVSNGSNPIANAVTSAAARD